MKRRIKFEIEFYIEGPFRPAKKNELQDENILSHLGDSTLAEYVEIKRIKYSRVKRKDAK